MRRSFAAALAALAVTLLAAAGCGGSDEQPIRIGLLTDCSPPLSAFREGATAAVEAPLLRRGARPAGPLPSDGLRDARVAGRPVELVIGCPLLERFDQLVQETRRLVEVEGADVVIGVNGVVDGTVLDQIAAREPGTTFVHGWSTSVVATLHDPLPNVFQPGPTSAQGVAGLATYAFRDLGWRTAAIVSEDYGTGWEYAAAFGAEFCALGGRIVATDYTSLLVPPASPDTVRRARAADGVAILSLVGTVAPLDYDGFISAFGRGRPRLARRVVLGGAAFALPQNLAWAADPTGIVVAQNQPFAPNRASRELQTTVKGAFPELDADMTLEPVSRYAQAAEAVVGALEAADGDLSDGQRRFRAALVAQRFESPLGTTAFDGHQGIATTYLGRVRRDGERVSVTGFEEIPGVDRTVGGLLKSPPQADTPSCPAGLHPPPWAR